ncbi:MAG TPA: ATPase domain-containing protein [Gemmatimonadaceae bacterium]|jgi:circadian clock protein KaiC|nr:ATPase domain-containing protein [Gemmatimonadaceae bacterium]
MTADLYPRIRTGNPQADDVLGGGFPSNSINIVMGQPGTGKTIFAEQLMFANTHGERPLLFITTLSEPLTKAVSYVQRFRFFDDNKLGDQIQYHDLGEALAADGPGAVVPWLTTVIKASGPKIIVIDSFRAIHDLASSAPRMRLMVSDLAGLLSAYDVTTFLLGEYTIGDIERYPEFAVGDGIVALARHPLSSRDERFFRVIKLRGSAYLEGQHAFRITDRGLELYPRLVSPLIPETYEPLLERVRTGVTGLDAMMGGGLWSGSTTLVAGPTGAGKTTVALQFALEGVRRGEPTLYVNFQENPAQLRRAIDALGMRADEAIARGLILRYESPVELQIDSIIVGIFERIRGGDVRRVVVDAIGDLAMAANDPQRLHDYLYALVQHFAVNHVTSMLTFESESGATTSAELEHRFSNMSDNVIVLGLGGEERSRRTLRVLKTRNSGHDPMVRELDIAEGGARIV